MITGELVIGLETFGFLTGRRHFFERLFDRPCILWLGKKCPMLSSDMTVKQQIHDLVDELPDDSPLLIEVHEALRMNHAIGEAMEDVRDGRTYGAEDFMAKVQERWPRKSSE
jgi:hypothetical protein